MAQVYILHLSAIQIHSRPFYHGSCLRKLTSIVDITQDHSLSSLGLGFAMGKTEHNEVGECKTGLFILPV